MEHIALYRKYRPQTFNDIIGQEHVTNILKKQVELKKISHAYIFSGTRGTGKTTAAKVFAKAINCTNSKEGEPCNECESCRAINEGHSTDVEELDAASNNSVDNIRSIRQEVAYVPTISKYKVYIIDEAHMLTKQAFNALLKTLEEPPENVVFILATTEEYKLLPTIKSRCLRFEFKKLQLEDIKIGISRVLKDMNISYDETAIECIAKVADGALRDALSILERCLCDDCSKLTVDSVKDILGIMDDTVICNLINSILSYDVIDTYKCASDVLNTGKDIRYVSTLLNNKLMEALIYVASNKECEVDEKIKQALDGVSVQRLNHCISVVSRLDDKLRQTTNMAITFMACILELATEVFVTGNDIGDKIKGINLEIEKIKQQKEQLVKNNIKQENDTQLKKATIEIPKEEKVNPPEIQLKQFKEIEQIAKMAADKDDLKLFSALAGAKAYYINQDEIVVETQNAFAYGLLKKEESLKELANLVEELMKKRYEISLNFVEQPKNKEMNKFEQMLKDTGVPFTIEE